jgi:photosystem II stability/assembly factor-like uncharacterized protein
MRIVFILFGILIINFSSGYSQGYWAAIPNAPLSGRFDDMYFINDSVGFVSQDSKVYRTTDKGNTWAQISTLDSTFDYVRSIEFVNDTIGFAGLLYSAFSLSGNIYKTIDGGFTWTLLQNMQINSYDGICGMAHYGNRLLAVGTYNGPAWFYKTDDFGASWTKSDLSNLMSGLVDCYMVSFDTILISGVADSANNYNASIIKSNDGGLTWSRVYLSNTSYMEYCWKMFFRPNGLGISSIQSYGPQLKIARTVDFGNTWSTITVDTALVFQGDLGGIALQNDTLGWVFDQYNLGAWETADGGLSWISINSPVIAGDRLVVLDSATTLAAGVTIYRYSSSFVGMNEQPLIPVPNQHTIEIYPNPGNNKITIDALAIRNTFGILDITDATGKIIKRVARQPFINGKNTFTVEVSNLPVGVYSAVWHTNERRVAKSFSIIH